MNKQTKPKQIELELCAGLIGWEMIAGSICHCTVINYGDKFRTKCIEIKVRYVSYYFKKFKINSI